MVLAHLKNGTAVEAPQWCGALAGVCSMRLVPHDDDGAMAILLSAAEEPAMRLDIAEGIVCAAAMRVVIDQESDDDAREHLFLTRR